MLLEALIALTVLSPLVADGLARVGPSAPEPAHAAVYEAEQRAVTNWRAQTLDDLRPVSRAVVARLAVTDPAFVARCVKLNNYWCIKRARWDGEIGADAEGHTAFATAEAGADAAAGLLRRYYRDYGRRTALAIVRRWAPAECRLAAPAPLAGSNARRSAQATSAQATSAQATSAPATSALAPKGIGGTLRARYLARTRGVARPARSATALRIQPWSPLARLRGRPGSRPLPLLRPVPDIAARTAEPEAAPRTRLAVRAVGAPRGADDPAALLARSVPSPDRLVAESASLPPIAAGASLLDLRAPSPICGGDEVRIANYAAAIARSVGLKPGDDLALFAPDGTPLPALAPVMLAMSAVELGTMRASPDLVAQAVARLAAGGRTVEAGR